VWIAAAAGMGKTTAIASYLEDRGGSGIWYQLDHGDRDPATFFYYLVRAAQADASDIDLPLFKANYNHDPVDFAHTFFRTLFSLVAPGWTMVLDNFHEVDPDSALPRILAAALAEAPSGVTLFVTSRAEPPAALARQIASNAVTVVGPDSLTFDIDETAALIALHGARVQPETVQQLCSGWPAGVVLIAARHGARAQRSIDTPPDLAYVFDYFADEVLRDEAEDVRQFLMMSAFMSRIPAAAAVAITQNEHAADILETLYRRNVFVDKRDGEQTTYQYHELFRSFLIRRATETYGAATVRQIKRRCASAFEAIGHFDEALEVYLEIDCANEAATLITTHARAVLQQGRTQTLAEWLRRLPGSVVRASAELNYWFGITTLAKEPAKAREHLQLAYASFVEREDVGGQLLAAATVIETHLVEFSDFGPVLEWMARMQPLLPHGAELLDNEDQLRIYANLLMASVCVPRPNLVQLARDQVMGLLDLSVEVNLRVRAATVMLIYCVHVGDTALARRVEVMVDRCSTDPALAPITLASWRFRLALVALHLGEIECAREMVHEMQRIVTEHKLESLQNACFVARVWCAVADENVEQAEAVLHEWGALTRQGPMDRLWWETAHGHVACLRGDLEAALHHVEQHALLLRSGTMNLSRAAADALRITVLAELGRFGEAGEHLVRMKEQWQGTPFTRVRSVVEISEAFLALMQQDARVPELLQIAVQTARRERYPCGPAASVVPRVRRRIIEAGLAHGIEIPYLQEVVRHLRFRPSNSAIPNWPWPVKIYAFGPLRMKIDDVPLEPGRKAQRKPLELLAVVVARGGKAVPTGEVMDLLWRDSDGDAARAAFENTLHRLRKMLQHASVLRLADGQLDLDETSCWVDVWEFERAVAQLDSASTLDEAALDRQALEAIKLYQGHLLVTEGDDPWIFAARERYRAQYVTTVQQLGSRWEARRSWDMAMRLYERALQVDALAEPFFRGMIRCLKEQGRRAEAMQTFRRCQSTLSKLLGVAPSPETQALARDLIS
jgi:DNA-binding SARP family transcriptional activator